VYEAPELIEIEPVGTEVARVNEPLEEYEEGFPKMSVALTLKYQVPSVKAVEWVKELVAEVSELTPVIKFESSDHWRA
jgi:hypothetical protein